MKFQTPRETIENVFTALPENFVIADMLLWVGTGVLVTWLFLLTVSPVGRKHLKWRIPVLLTAAALGLIGYTLYQNINENLGGYYLSGKMLPDEMIFPAVDADPDSPGRDYLLYFPGSILGKRFESDIVKTENSAVIPHGYNAAARRFAGRLRPQDRLHLVGFSRGGGEALAVASSIRRPVTSSVCKPIASLVLADPTADLLQALECRLHPCSKPENVDYFKVFTVRKYDAATASNDAVRQYHFFMVAKFIDPRYVTLIDSGDHGMYTTGYRIDENSRYALEKLRLRVLADHASHRRRLKVEL